MPAGICFSAADGRTSADFAHPVVFQGKTRLELVHRAAAHEIEYADYCISQAKTLHIRWVPGVIMKRNTEVYIVLTRTFQGGTVWSGITIRKNGEANGFGILTAWNMPVVFGGLSCVP